MKSSKKEHIHSGYFAFLICCLFFAGQINLQAQCNFATAAGSNLVSNADFELGNSGFSSPLSFQASDLSTGGTYTVTNQAGLVNSMYSSTDHSSGSGKFMVVNFGSTGGLIWTQTIAVTPNTDYVVGAWFKNVLIKSLHPNLTAARIRIRIDGTSITPELQLTDTPDVWRNLEANWNSGSKTSISLELFNAEGDLNGNDFGIDDIYMKACCAKVNAGIDQEICQGDSAILQADGSGTFLWSPVFYINNLNVSNPVVRPPVTARYYVTRTQGSCTTKDTVEIRVTPIQVDAGTAPVICIGDSFQLNPTVKASSFGWQNVPGLSDSSLLKPWFKPSGNTALVLTGKVGTCTKTDTLFVSVLSSIVAKAGNDTFTCLGTPVKLNASGGNSYQWWPNYKIDNINSRTPLVNPDIDTFYVVKVEMGAGCSAYDTLNILVSKGPELDLGRDRGHCFDGAVIINTTLNSPIDSFTWDDANGLNDASNLRPFAAIKGKKQFAITAWWLGCKMRDSVLIYEMPKVTAAFVTSPQSAVAPAWVQFVNKSTNATRFSWEFGDGSFPSTETNPRHYFQDTGNFIVRLFALDSLECADRATVTIPLSLAPYVEMPTSFTPNGDGLNDVFKPAFNQEAFEWLTLRIYNSWGEEIFSTQYPGGTWWNGYAKDGPCMTGTYWYTVEALGKNQAPFNRKGTVYLLK
ncbi:MAG: gliding motility-associated C-terminal domain-containing protein [Bacteroidetes bacterium]|nr:gliding motility-associated C-terminal domain-containing protein [Bacteroidota bacterium]